MAWKGTWGTFVHIPKCGGYGLRRFLKDHMGKGHDDPPYHGLPETVENGFTLVRHPVSWLRSIYAYRVQHDWEIRRDGRNRMAHVSHWPVIMGLTQWAEGSTWSEFVDGLCEVDNDIVYTVYGMYRHPAVKVYKLEEVHQLLFDLGIDHELPVTHETPDKPEVTPRQRMKLEHLCRYSMREYGYSVSELTEVDDSNVLSTITTLRQRCAQLESV